MNMKYLKLLAKEYPTVSAASAEIINLNAICCLPKGTEYFFSDLHGEYEAFLHLLKSASGMIRSKIEDIFSRSVSGEERSQLADLIYYPEEKLAAMTLKGSAAKDWQKITIYRLVHVCKAVSSKYTRSKVRKKMPNEFAYIIDELLHADNDVNKEHYYGEIINSIVQTGMAGRFITAMCYLIQSLSIDNLHIIGDIFDRGPRADIIMEELIHFHDVDIQWGNHDISWMGAASGNLALIANVVRMALSYNNFDLLEDGYAINLRALSMFAAEVYKEDPCMIFKPHILDENQYDPVDAGLAAKMHKAISVIQFKLEGQLIRRHPEYEMEDRSLLERIDYKRGTVTIGEKEYPLRDSMFPTVDPGEPLALTEGEKELMNTIAASFFHSSLLHKHIRFLYSHGSMYKCVNSNLLYHGCIPMTADGEFEKVNFDGRDYAGKELLDYIELQVQNAYFLRRGTKDQKKAGDLMWYLWSGAKSPLFGKSKLSAFEHYFIEDISTHKEILNPYYKVSEKEEICDKILNEFGLGPESHIINGHVPVKLKEGESPVKGGGKLFVIDGGISKAYQSKTGIAGYTLIYNSHNLSLAEHRASTSTPEVKVVEVMKKRMTVMDTDIGKNLKEQIADLMELSCAYRDNILKEKI